MCREDGGGDAVSSFLLPNWRRVSVRCVIGPGDERGLLVAAMTHGGGMRMALRGPRADGASALR